MRINEVCRKGNHYSRREESKESLKKASLMLTEIVASLGVFLGSYFASYGAFRWSWFHVPAKERGVTYRVSNVLFLHTVNPFTITASSTTLFLIENEEEVWAEDVLAIDSSSWLLVYSCSIPPFLFNLHCVSLSFFALRDLLRRYKWPCCVDWTNLRRVIHVNLVNSVVRVAFFVQLPEHHRAQCREAYSIARLMLSYDSV